MFGWKCSYHRMNCRSVLRRNEGGWLPQSCAWTSCSQTFSDICPALVISPRSCTHSTCLAAFCCLVFPCWLCGPAGGQWIPPFPSLWIWDFPPPCEESPTSFCFPSSNSLAFFFLLLLFSSPSSSGESAPPAENRHHDKRGVWPPRDPALER